MFKKLALATVALSMSATLYAGIDFDDPAANNLKKALTDIEIEAGAVPAPGDGSERAVKEWTVMVFMNGKNDLERFALKDLNEMEMAGSSGRVNIVAEIGRMNGQRGDVHSDGDWTTVRRCFVKKDADARLLKRPGLARRSGVSAAPL